MASLNKVQIIGNLGQDPTTRYMPNGEAVTNITVATTESWKDKNSGEKKGPLSPDDEKRLLHRQSLELNRARVLEQLKRSQNPRYTEMLTRELEQLERELASKQ